MPRVNVDTLDEDIALATIDVLVDIIRTETDTLRDVLPEALAAQWSAAPRQPQADNDARKSEGAAPSNPTADIALDGRRLALRAQVIRSERILRHLAIGLRGVRIGVERSLDRLDPEP